MVNLTTIYDPTLIFIDFLFAEIPSTNVEQTLLSWQLDRRRYEHRSQNGYTLTYCSLTWLGLVSCLRACYIYIYIYSLLWRFGPIPGHGLPLRGFAITLTGHTTLGSTPLHELSARRRKPYLTTLNTRNRQASIPWRDSNPQSQKASGRTTWPQTARPLGSAHVTRVHVFIHVHIKHNNVHIMIPTYFCLPFIRS